MTPQFMAEDDLRIYIQILRERIDQMSVQAVENKGRLRVQENMIEAATDLLYTQSKLISKLYLAYMGADDSVSEDDHNLIMVILGIGPDNKKHENEGTDNYDELPF